jgi:hypothetical protein
VATRQEATAALRPKPSKLKIIVEAWFCKSVYFVTLMDDRCLSARKANNDRGKQIEGASSFVVVVRAWESDEAPQCQKSGVTGFLIESSSFTTTFRVHSATFNEEADRTEFASEDSSTSEYKVFIPDTNK